MWVDLEGIILREMSEEEKYDVTCGIHKMKSSRFPGVENKPVVSSRERDGEGRTGVGGQEVKLLSLKQVSYKDMLHSARNTVFY